MTKPPKPFIGSLRGSESEQDEQIQIAWNTRWNDMRTWFQAHDIKGETQKRERLPEHLAFFFDGEHQASPLTTVNTWSNNKHYGLVFGMRDVQVRNIDKFALYREKVGAFPTQPPKWWKPNNSWGTALQTAFEEAWKPFRAEYGAIDGTAARVYSEITNEVFIDQETQYMKSTRPMQATQASKP